ncbi:MULTISPECIES: hypothetical protein [unclassified Pedobacter]|uniref:hypothetical protein n=1 Tax=unclassified Pedobacter TaxID=2628915 RepID=UPI001421B4C4|nr:MULTISPECIES: hypothetical protein [unclassified Pedobacter]NII83452.1 hypothetical protein [Pedobacter sp. SG908]NMN37317.1 hypothetical protein [Pedobacter sp. SG918]
MIKLTKDNHFFWSRIFPGVISLNYLALLLMIILTGAYFLLIAGIIFFLLHFGVGKIWRYYFIYDLYIDGMSMEAIRKNEKIYFFKSDILSCSRRFGIVTLKIASGKEIFLILNSKENIKYLKE